MSIRLATANDLATSATSLLLDTPAQTIPGASVTLTGTYQGNPQNLDYRLSGTSSWVEASAVNFNNGTFSFSVPGVAAGTYSPQVRDHTTTSVSSIAGNFVVSSWTPETLASSPGAHAVFEFNANDPSIAAGASGAAVQSVLNSVNSAQSLTAELATSKNPIVIADNSGATGTSRVLQFHPTTISPNSYDPATNWLSAGGRSGTAPGLVSLADSSNLGTDGAFTTIVALYINNQATTKIAVDYEAGPLWGSPSVGGPFEYIQMRENVGSGYLGANLVDRAGDPAVNAQSKFTTGWHVLTMIKGNGSLTYRLDGKPVQTAAITATAQFRATDFMLGGGYAPGATQENGVPPPYVGEFQAYSGVLSGTDLANAEKLAGNAIGLSLSPTGTGSAPVTIALSAPGTLAETSVGAGVDVSETVTTTGGLATLYEEVLTASGAIETPYQAVSLSNGTATTTIHLLHSGDTIQAVDSLTAPTVTAKSSAVTITDPIVTALTAKLPNPLYVGTDIVTGIGGVAGLQLERITQGTYSTPGTTGWVKATVAADGTWSASLAFTKAGMLAHVYAENGGTTKVVDLVDGTPVNPPSTPAATITASAPGTVQEAAVGAGVTVSEHLSTTNLTGTVYAEVLTASRTVETAYQPVTLASDGTAAFSVHLAKSGDIVQIVDNTTAPTVTADSAPVTITDPAPVYTIAVSAPGTVQEASVGAGVDVVETVTTTGGLATVYAEVLTASGTIESPYQAETVGANGSAAFSMHLAHSGDIVQVVDNSAAPTVTAKSGAVTITDPTSQVLTAVLPSPLYTGVETVTGTGGIPGLQLERITQGTYSTPGTAGWVAATVASNGNWSAQLTFTKPGMLAHVYAENGGSSKIVDLVDGTPLTAPASASLTQIASSLQGTIAGDMSIKTIGAPLTALGTQIEPASGGGLLPVAATQTAVMVPDHLKLLNG